MSRALSNTKIDELGDRIRAHEPTAEDLTLLDQWRLTFAPSLREITERLHAKVLAFFTVRAAKSTDSIVAKLRRQPTLRLSQMQDIAGLRFVVPRWYHQEERIELLSAVLDVQHVDDRRNRPDHGYRAVHLIARSLNRPVEVQVRTELQHKWAEVCERTADLLGPSVKYGGGPDSVRDALLVWSTACHELDLENSRVALARAALPKGERPQFRDPGLVAAEQVYDTQVATLLDAVKTFSSRAQ
jgi:putative GTP pyrophosphokinase